MTAKGDTITKHLLLFVSGLALIFLAHTQIETASPMTSRVLEALGFALAGYAPIRLVMSITTLLGEGWRARLMDRAFRSGVRIVSPKKVLPLLIVADAEGCITPPHRTEVDLRKFQRLRAYCEFVKSEAGQEFPPLLIYTGRPQGYVEMLAQVLGVVDSPLDLPFVIENGAALYFPVSRKTVPITNDEQRRLSEKIRNLLIEKMPQNEFEPKIYMTTINALPDQQTIDKLRQEVIRILKDTDVLDSLVINSTASAVDITPKNINKLVGLKEAIKEYHNLRPDTRGRDLDAVVGIADSTSDLCVLEEVGRAYCSAHDVAPEVRKFVEQRFGTDHVIDRKHIDFVIAVIEKECGLHII